MLVKVRLYGHLPDLAGKKELSVEVNEPTVRGLLESMRQTCPQALIADLADLASDPPELLSLAAVDGVATFYAEGINTALKEGCEVVFMPALAGGALEGCRWHRRPCLWTVATTPERFLAAVYPCEGRGSE